MLRFLAGFGLPLGYTLRNIAVRRASAMFSALGIALTVAVFAGVISLRHGFEQVYKPRGATDLAVYLRPGTNSEGESGLSRRQVQILLKERPEIARDEKGRPLAAAEAFLAVYLELLDGGLVNVPLRGIQPTTLRLHGDALRLVEGRWPRFGSDEVVVGRPLTWRMRNCRLGDILPINATPFRVVGIFEHDGVYGSEIWGDVERVMDALDRPFYSRVIAKVRPGTDFKALAEDLLHDPRTPAKVLSERAYLRAQTTLFGGALTFLAVFLSGIMGVAAVLGAMNTMLAAVASRTHEIGVLLALGFRRQAVFLAFMAESALIGLLGGAAGCLLVLPFDGVRTGAMNWNTFTDISFRFDVTPDLLVRAFGMAFLLGILGGALPALRAAMLRPVDAFRQL